MFYWSAAFVVIACAAAFMGINGLAGISAQAAWGLFLASAILALLTLLLSRRQPDGLPPVKVKRDPSRKLGDI